MKDNIISQLKKKKKNAFLVKWPLQTNLICRPNQQERNYLSWEKLSQFHRAGKPLLLTQTHLYCQGSTELIANAKPQLGVGRTKCVKCSAGECPYQSPPRRGAGFPPPLPSRSPLFSIQAESEKVFSSAARCQPDLGSSAGIAERSRNAQKPPSTKHPFI